MNSRLSRLYASILCLLMLIGLPQTAPAQTPPPANNPQASMLAVNSPTSAGDYFHLQEKIYRWSDQTRFVLVHVSTASYLPDWQTWDPQIVKDAFGEWQRAINNRLMFIFMDDTTQADIVVNWWDRTTPGIESGAAGINQSQTWGKYIAQDDIYLALHREDGRPRTPQELYATALHEIGHSLGIKVHSDNPGDLMYYAVTPQSRLSQRDVNTMLRIYASKPDYINPPGFHLSRFEDFKKTQKNKGRIWIPIIIPIPI